MADERRPRSGWTIVRLAGIDIRVHPTFLFLIALVLLGFLGPPAAGLVWLGLVFGSVIAHELGHAIVARHRGMIVRDIVLLPIGGASEIDDLPDRPEDELVVAIAGPLVSIGLAATLALGLWSTTGSIGAPSLATGRLLDRLAWTNLMLAAFNLLPALPMDGGRVYRAAVARRRGFVEATRSASRLSRRLAAVMAAVGILYMPWFLLIAGFVYVTGRAEEQAVLMHTRLAGVTVRDVMVPLADPTARIGRVTAVETEPVEEALHRMADAGDDAATVVDVSGRTVGVLLLDRIADRFRDAA